MPECPLCHQAISDQQWQLGTCPQCNAQLSYDSELFDSNSTDPSTQTVLDSDLQPDHSENKQNDSKEEDYKTIIDEELQAEIEQISATAKQADDSGDQGDQTVMLDAGHALFDEEQTETVFDDIPSRPAPVENTESSGENNAGEATVCEQGIEPQADQEQTILDSGFSEQTQVESTGEAGTETVVTESGAVAFDENKTVQADEDLSAADSAQTLISDGEIDPVAAAVEKTWGMGLASVTDPGMTIKASEINPRGTGSQHTIPLRHLEEQTGQSDHQAEYQLVEVLGEGGMGIVWNALQSSVERNVAIKMIKTKIAKKPGQTEKFIDEAIVTGDLEHPNIVPIHEMGQDRDGNFFYAMKHVQGIPWNKVILKKTLHENLEILLSVCDAIAFAHARGIIHRDLKPENIMLGGYGEVLVMDWGLALPTKEFTKRGLISGAHGMGGTPAYMAPEMAAGPIDRISYTSDVYLLGAILYEIITERPPHRGKTVQGCVAAAMRNTIYPTDRDDELVEIARRAMQTNPQDRYPSVKAFQDALRGYLSHEKSLKLSKKAAQELEEAAASNDYDKFARSLFGFEEALVLWEDNASAKQGELEARLAYARCALEKGDFDLAESLLEKDQPAQKELYEKIQQAKAERDRKQRMFRLAKFVVAGLAATILLIVGVSYYLINQEMKRATAAEKIANEQRQLAEDRTVEVMREKEKVEKQKTIAQQERDKAEQQKKEAEKQRAIAVVEKEKAVQAREAEQYKSYIAKIGLAAAKVEENAFSDAQNLLLQCPASLRNWEWGRLMYLCSQSKQEYLSPAPVHSLDFSPDGSKFVSACFDGKARIWERETGKLIHELPHDNIYVHAVAWARSGNLIATGGNDKQGNLKLWDSATGKLLASVSAHADAVLSLKFSDDEQWLLTTSYDNSARLWNLENRAKPKLSVTLIGHTWWVWDADFVPGFRPAENGSSENKTNRIVTVGHDEKAIVWEISKQGTEAKPVIEFLEHQGPIYSVAYHPAGTEIATGGYDRKILYWNPDEIKPFDFAAAVKGEKKEPQQYVALTGHTGPVRAVSFSHDGNLLLSGAQDNAVKVWDLESASSIKTFRGHDGTVRACELTKDGRYLLSGSEDHRALLWSVDDYAEIQTLNGQELVGHREAILAAYFSPSGKEVLTASRDRTAIIWDVNTGKERIVLKEGHRFLSSSALFFQNEQLLATAAADNSVRIWNATSGAELAHLMGTGRSGLVAISSDDQQLVTGSNGNDLIVWKTESLLKQQEVSPLAQLTGHKHPVTAIAFIPGTHQLVSADSRGRCTLWNTDTGEVIWSVRHHTLKVSDIRIIDQGQTILTANIDQTIGVTRVENGEEVAARVLSHSGPVIAIDVSADESKLLSVVNQGDNEQNQETARTVLSVWNLGDSSDQKKQPARRIVLEGFTTNDVSISHDNSTAILTCSDNSVKMVDLETEEIRILIDGNQHGGLLWATRLSNDGRRLLSVGGIDARLWDLKTGKQQMSFGPHGAVAATAMHPHDQIVVTGSWDHSLKFWDARSGKSIGKISEAHQGYINSVSYSHDGRWLVSAGDEGIAIVWDVMKNSKQTELVGHTGSVQSAVFSPDDQVILTASRDRTVRLWNRETGQPIGQPMKGHEWAVLAARFSPDGKLIVSGSEDNSAILWDRQTGKILARMSGHTAAVTSVAYSRDGMRVLTASRDNTAKLWDVSPGHLGNEILTLKRHNQEVTCVDFSKDRLHAVTSSRDGTAIIWPALQWKE